MTLNNIKLMNNQHNHLVVINNNNNNSNHHLLLNPNNKIVRQPIKNFHIHPQIVLDQVVVAINQQLIDLNLAQNQVQLKLFLHLI
jgi:hypothetical protein